MLQLGGRHDRRMGAEWAQMWVSASGVFITGLLLSIGLRMMNKSNKGRDVMVSTLGEHTSALAEQTRALRSILEDRDKD